jgi:WD40 repeat protein
MVLATYMGHDGPVRSISLYDGDRKIASGGFDGAIKVLLVSSWLLLVFIIIISFVFLIC